MTYPATWPKPNPARPDAVHSRITEAQKVALYRREITTRKLAEILGVNESYLSTCFPGKAPTTDPRDLTRVRREYRLEIGKQVLEGRYTIGQAADVAHCSYNTMQRFVARAKTTYPHLVENYNDIVRNHRRAYAQTKR